MDWSGVVWCFYQLFGLSFWRHPFTAEHPLLRHWCRHISTNLMKKQTHPNLGCPEDEYIFIFGWTIPLRPDHTNDHNKVLKIALIVTITTERNHFQNIFFPNENSLNAQVSALYLPYLTSSTCFKVSVICADAKTFYLTPIL